MDLHQTKNFVLSKRNNEQSAVTIYQIANCTFLFKIYRNFNNPLAKTIMQLENRQKTFKNISIHYLNT
jgi:hypothetical protein